MPVFFDLADRYSSGPRRILLLNTKAALSVTAVLLVVGTVAIAAMEWRNPATLGELGFAAKLQAAFFQGATPRTAGFNSVDIGAMQSGTIVAVMLLMFIGGSPGSTAGGIKTTTFLVLIASVWAYARGRAPVYMFGRRIEPQLTIRAGVVATLGVLLVAGGLIALTFTERSQPFLSVFFEAVSALGTVGLSLGATPELSSPGKLIIIGLMFTGRIGLLTFALALVEEREVRRLRYPREDVIIG